MNYSQKTPLFDIMQEYTTIRSLPKLTINRSYLKLMNQITGQLKAYGFPVDESGLNNHNMNQALKIIFNINETKYTLSVKHIDKNPLSKVGMFIEGGKYNSNTHYTPQDAMQEITDIIKNN